MSLDISDYEIVPFNDTDIDESKLYPQSGDNAITTIGSKDFNPHDQVALSHPSAYTRLRENDLINATIPGDLLDYNYDIGGFKSNRKSQDKKSKDQDSALEVELTFGPGNRDYWGGLLALTHFEFHTAGNSALCLDMCMSNIIRNQFTLKVYSPYQGDTMLYNAGVSWIRFPSNDSSFQFGVYKESGCNSQPPPAFKDIIFPSVPGPISTMPKVFVALGGFILRDKWQIATNATNVSYRGFRLNIDVNFDSKKPMENSSVSEGLGPFNVIWIATSRPNVFIGQFEGNSNSWDGYVRFPSNQYNNSPALFTGISGFHLRSTRSSEQIVSVKTNVFPAGFTWAIEAEDNSRVQVNYMAVF